MNPFLDAYNEMGHHNIFDYEDLGNHIKYKSQKDALNGYSYFEYRNLLVKKYAWAVPNLEALTAIVRHSPLIEIGAGTGYWGSLIKKFGGDIICYDNFSWEFYQDSPKWTDVHQGDETAIDSHPDRTLFLCWPPYDNPMAHRCLLRWKAARKASGLLSNKLIYIGEGSGGCNADDDFWQEIESLNEIQSIEIPQFRGIHDFLRIFENYD